MENQNLIGRTFGLYEVMSLYCIDDRSGKAIWLCECHGCNKMHRVYGSNLTAGISSSCKKCSHKDRKPANQEQRLIGITMRKESGDVVQKHFKQFKEPLRNLYQAYKKKSRAEAQCAVNDMVKIFKQFEEEKVVTDD